VFPNSPNVVAGRVRVWFEIRHEDEAVVLAISDRFLARIEQEASAIGVHISIAVDERRAAPTLDPAGFELVRGVASDLGMKTLALKTVTGHDALAIQKRIPSSLIFVPSQDGLSRPAACWFQLSNLLTTNLGVRSPNLFGRAILPPIRTKPRSHDGTDTINDGGFPPWPRHQLKCRGI
jgi:metal-dependent amidase/aminoacylase/carboxypeptidase family protein